MGVFQSRDSGNPPGKTIMQGMQEAGGSSNFRHERDRLYARTQDHAKVRGLPDHRMNVRIHDLLFAWGRWAIRQETHKVGYPPVAAGFGDYRPPGVGLCSQIPIGVGTTVDDLAAVNAAVLQLPMCGRILCNECYVIGGRLEDVAKRMGISRSTLLRERARVHEAISCELCSESSGKGAKW